jgi:hypothetical protein
MKNIVKLLTAVLVFGFLVGCGGGGGGSSSSSDNTSKGDDPTTPSGDNTGISLALIKSYFPAFNDSGYDLRDYDTGKFYNATAAQIANFNTTVVQAQSYDDFLEGMYYKDDVKPYIDATVSFSEANKIGVYLSTYSSTTTIDDSTYNSVFGSSIGGNVVAAWVWKLYTNDGITSKFDTYALSLTSQGFNCSKGVSTGGEWICSKTVGNLVYGWESDYNSNGYVHYVELKGYED